MSRNLVRPRAYSIVAVMLILTLLLLIQSQAEGRASVAATLSPQGKGGAIKPVPTPTPAPKKTTPKKSQPPARVNTKSNPQPKADESAATERTYWETIRNSTDVEDFRAYLKKYPNGQFADLANNRIRALEAAKIQPSPTATPTPAPIPEPIFDWVKSERDLPAPVRVEWREKGPILGEQNLDFSVPAGWTRTRREQGKHYLQISFRAPDSPQTTVSIQLYAEGIPVTLRNGTSEFWYSEKELINDRRNQYASQQVSAKLTDTESINHPTGHWHTFTADVFDVNVLEKLVPRLDAAYPDDVWQKGRCSDTSDFCLYELKTGSLGPFTRTRHSYAIRKAGPYGDFIVILYTAPIEKFDDKMLPSVMATLKMSGSTIKVRATSSDSSSLPKFEPEIVLDGERKGDAYQSYPVNVGKHRVTVRAKEHEPFEKDVFVRGWEALDFEVKLKRIANSTSGVKPK